MPAPFSVERNAMKHAKQEDGIFYGTTEQGYDLYLCESMGGQSLVARFGDRPGDYESCPLMLFKSWIKPGALIGIGNGRSVLLADWINAPTTPDYVRGWKKIFELKGDA